jgi:hypothetical protein
MGLLFHRCTAGRNDVGEAIFWSNYFFHCERIRIERLKRSKPEQPVDKRDSESGPYQKMLVPLEVEAQANEANESHLDDLSLVSASLADDDSSYVIPSAPNSLNTYTTTRSIDDLVLVGRDDECNE